MKKFLLTLCFFSISLYVYSAPLTIVIPEQIQHQLPNAEVGMQVIDAESGAVLYQRDALKSFTPASNTKLFTAVAAWYQLGPKFRFQTELLAKSGTIKGKVIIGNVYIRFGGDPSLTQSELKKLTHQLKLKGIQTIKGNFILDTHLFKRPYYAEGTSINDVAWSYMAPVSAIMLNENAVRIDIQAANQLKKKVRIQATQSAEFIKFTNNVMTVTDLAANKHCNFNVDINSDNHFSFYGCWPISKRDVRLHLSIANPFLLAKNVITTQLAKDNITLTGQIIKASSANANTVMAKHTSKPLKQLLITMLQDSNNLYANAITKMLGNSVAGEGSFKQGVYAIKRILARHTNIDTAKLVLVDGAGSRYNLLTPQQITQLLFVAYHDKALKEFLWRALPKAAKTGTLQTRMPVFNLKNNIIAKTGTMHDLSALSGYAQTASGRQVIFSILINHVVGGIKQAKQLENSLVGEIVRNS